MILKVKNALHLFSQHLPRKPPETLGFQAVFHMQSTHKSTRLQNFRENALHDFCCFFQVAFDFVLVSPRVHALRVTDHLL